VWVTYRDSKAGRHAVEIVRVLAHSHDLGYNGLVRPLDAEHFGQFLEILSRGLTDREDGVTEPAHTQAAELLVEELDAELRCEKRNVFDDGQSNAPLLVFGELDNGGKEGLREQLDSDDVVDRLELGDNVQADIGELILEHLQEHWKKMCDGPRCG
jgi:hypothetical protein